MSAEQDLTPEDQETAPDRPPRHRRRRSDRNFTSSLAGKIILALVGVLSTGATGYLTAMQAVGDRERSLLVQIAAIEARQQEQYKALHQRLEDIKYDFGVAKSEIRSDINGTREEIMRILRAIQ